ncbi:M16 family metallopeptidase [Rhodothermus bifroesti]|jgi:zinc protease|uniref:Insulinase family protein n=1 Tax=Rhodothermus marinus TaxID=29549 RepID=A0A7V2F659_RHOMR|nr:pitrilysin family protein [Rhodothermus bifroesti]GBD00543.1 putative zinc protease [bacterium HR18]
MERNDAALEVLPAVEGFTFVESVGGIAAYRLAANDLDVLLMPQNTVPVVVFMITYHVGSRNEPTGLTGATHMLEHLMFKGTARFHKAQGTSVFQVLQRVGAQVNATTWLDRTNYYALLPREHLSLAVEIEADRMRGALLLPEDVEAERTVILNEMDRSENDPLRNLYQAVWSVAFVAHPYRHPTIGWRSDVENITAEALRHFYDTFYWPNNATVSIIGDFELEEALKLVQQHFGPIERSPRPIPAVWTREPVQRGERRLVLHQAGELGVVMVAFKSPAGLDPDADALDVLACILSQGRNSRLYRKLTDTGRTLSVTATNERHRDPGLFYVVARLAPGVAHAEVEAILLEELAQVAACGVSEEEVARAQTQLAALEVYGRDGPFAIAAQLNEAIAIGDWKLYATYLDRIACVTAVDIQRVAQTYLTEAARTVGWYVPQAA